MSGAIIPGGPRVPAELVTDAGVNVESDAELVVGGTRTIDFEGAGVSVANDSGVAVVTISGGAGGTVQTDASLKGDGSGGDLLGINPGHVPVVADGTTIAGNGLTGTSLHTIDGATGVAVDGTTIAGTGKTGAPLHTVDGGTGVAVDGTTIGGTGKTGSPLHTIGGGGGGAPILTISRFRPADQDTVILVSNSVNVIDVQDVVNFLQLQLPLSAASGSGAVVEVAIVNLSAAPDVKRAQFIGIGPPNAVGVVGVACSGADTCNGVLGFAFASFVKLSDNARFVSDGVLDWIVTSASWMNAVVNTATLAPGNNQVVFPGAIPEIIYCGGLAGNTSVIQALSAGYIGQKIIIQNTDTNAHTFKLQPGFGGALTGNCQALAGLAAGYTLAAGSMRMLEFNFNSVDATLGNWYVIGDG